MTLRAVQENNDCREAAADWHLRLADIVPPGTAEVAWFEIEWPILLTFPMWSILTTMSAIGHARLALSPPRPWLSSVMRTHLRSRLPQRKGARYAAAAAFRATTIPPRSPRVVRHAYTRERFASSTRSRARRAAPQGTAGRYCGAPQRMGQLARPPAAEVAS